MVHHGAGLRTLLGDGELARALALDPEGAPLDPADRAMVDYALKLTRHPGDMDEADLAPLRDAGFDDRAILDIAQVTAYYNYVNRLADGLGVELEAYWDDDDMILSRTEMEARRATLRRDPGGPSAPDPRSLGPGERAGPRDHEATLPGEKP